MKAFLLFLGLFTGVLMQVSAQEKLTPFFEQTPNKMVFITKDLAKKHGLFTEYSTFIEARLFQITPAEYALEVLYTKSDSIYKDRLILPAESKNQYIDSLYTLVVQHVSNAPVPLDDSGKTPLIVGASIVSIGYYGVAAAIITNRYSNSFKMPFASYMFTAAGGIVVPYLLTKNKPISMAQASLTFHGQSRGVIHGFALGLSVDNTMDDVSLNFLAAVTSIAEGVGGFHLAKNMDLTIGQAGMYQFGIDAGFLGGILISDMAGFYKSYSTRCYVWGSVLGTSLVGGAAGLFAGQQYPYTLGDAIYLRSAMALGAFLPIPVLESYNIQIESKAYSIGAFAGGMAGVIGGHYLIKNRYLSTSQGVYSTLGQIAGGLLGAGTAYLIYPHDTRSEMTSYLLWGSSLGMLSGLGLMTGLLHSSNPKSQSSVSFQMHINPASLMFMKSLDPVMQTQMPLASCSVRF